MDEENAEILNYFFADNVHLHPRKPTASQGASQAVWPAGRGRGFCPFTLLCSGEIPAGVLRPALEP